MPKSYYVVKLRNRKTGNIKTVKGRAKSPSSLTRRHGYSGSKYQITDFHVRKGR